MGCSDSSGVSWGSWGRAVSWGQGRPACLRKEQGHLSRVLPGLQDGRWSQNGLRESFTGHTVSSKPEAGSAAAQEAAHCVMAGVVTGSPLVRSPTLVHIYTGVPVAVEVEAGAAGAFITANAVLTSLLAGSSQALIGVLAAMTISGQLHAWPTLAHETTFRVHTVALTR